MKIISSMFFGNSRFILWFFLIFIICFLFQNGSVWDALMIWKKNIDTKFDGVEECYICFSVFHATDFKIPKLSCHTCKKKYHAACLVRFKLIIIQK